MFWNLLLMKMQTSPIQMFYCEYCKIFKNSFFIEHYWWLFLYQKFFVDITHRSSHQNTSLKKDALKCFCNIHRKTPVLKALFDTIPGFQVCNFIKKRLQHRCFHGSFAKFLRVPILKNIYEQVILDINVSFDKGQNFHSG